MTASMRKRIFGCEDTIIKKIDESKEDQYYVLPDGQSFGGEPAPKSYSVYYV